MKTRSIVLFVSIVILLSFGVSTFSSIFSLGQMVEQNSEKEAAIFVRDVEGEIVDSFSSAADISQTINNTFMRNVISKRDAMTESEVSGIVGEYLNEIKNRFHYDTAFLIMDKTKEYFTEFGRIKKLNLEGEDDSWYPNFIKSNKEIELNVDNDQANDNRITVYVNLLMRDEAGKTIGVCGVGHTLDALNTTIDNFEKERSLSICLADSNGVIKLAGNDSLCGNKLPAYLQSYLDYYDHTQEYIYDKSGTDGYIIAKYIKDYDWYVIIEHSGDSANMTAVVLRNLLAAFVSLIFTVIFVSIAFRNQAHETISFKLDAQTDKMTGLSNRRAYEEMLEEIKKNNSAQDVSVFIVDVNGLKAVNDEFGHQAGDELIVKTAECLKNICTNHGRIFRIGGDEFAVIITEPLDDIGESVRYIREQISKCVCEYSEGLSAAIGAAKGQEHPEMDIEELIRLADKAMYFDKEDYYRDIRHERRKR